jgi:hypothetical protein
VVVVVLQQEASVPPWVVALTERYNVSFPIKLYNFAWSGATIDEDLVVPYVSTVQSFKSTFRHLRPLLELKIDLKLMLDFFT